MVTWGDTLANKERQKRTHLDIWAAILECLVLKEATLSRIVISANLNRPRTKKYMDALISQGLIVKKIDTLRELCYH